ncbi:MAG: alpha/beta hydrolase [bacterium JZ-2024 1]
MGKRAGALLLGVLLLGLAYPPQKGAKEQEFSVKTSDGFLLQGKMYYPEQLLGEKFRKVLLLLHQWNRTQEEWENPYGVVSKFRREGFVVVTFDFRGHGKSIVKGEKRIGVKDLRAGDISLFPDDVGDVMKYVEATLKGAEKDVRILTYVMGASIGANAGLIYAAREKQVVALILLSPGKEYHGLGVMQAAREYAQSNRPAFFIAARDDEYSANTLEEIRKTIPAKNFRFEIFPSGGHGWALFAKYADLSQKILNWMSTQAVGELKFGMQ